MKPEEKISQGVDITFTKKADDELIILALDCEIELTDIEDAIKNFAGRNYYWV